MYRLTLLGAVLLDGPEGPVSGRATQQRRLALLALLGSAGDRGRSREQLISLLWSETDPQEARQHLSHSIYSLRSTLGQDSIRTAGQFVRLSPAHIEVDTVAFEEALDRGDLEAAAAAYAGPFLDGFFADDAPEFERWVDEERRRLAELYTQAVKQAATEAGRAGDDAAAVKWWVRLVQQDPYSSAAVLQLMEALYAEGDPANALLVAREHRDRLDEDLGVEPTAEVEELAERIRHEIERVGKRTGRVTPSTGPPTLDPAPLAGSRRPGIRHSRLAWIAGAVLALVLVALWIGGTTDRRGGEVPVESLAVIPFMNLTGDPDYEYLVDGVTDQLIATLSRVPDLKVPAQTSSFVFKHHPLDVRAVADSLGVRTIVEGSVRVSGSGFVVTAQLIDATTGYHLWTGTYDRRREDLLGAQLEIARGAVEALGLSPVESPPSGARTRLARAWDDYARARHWWRKRTPVGTDTAIVYFRRAVEDDPAWALAWSGLADAHVTGMFWGHLPVGDSLQAEIQAMAERAVRLDSTLAEARTSLGAVLSDIEGDHEAAAHEFRRAIDLNPNYAVARQWYGEALFMRLGRPEEGLRELRRAYEVDPLSPILAKVLADLLWWSPGGAEEAVRFYDLAIDLEPDHWSSHSNKAKALACLVREEEARAALESLLEVGHGSSRAAIDAVDVLGILRDYDSAVAMIERIREEPDTVEFTSDIEAYLAGIALGVYLEQGRYDDALAEYRTMADLVQRSPNTLALTLAWIYARSGDEEASRAILESVPADRRPRQRAGVLAALGDYDQALDLLRRVVTEDWVLWDVACLGADPDFDAVRDDPQYIRLMERIGQPVGD